MCYLSVSVDFGQCVPDEVAVVLEVDVLQHFSTAEQHGSGIGDVLTDSLRVGMPCTLKKKLNVLFALLQFLFGFL